eukprot:gene18394-22513_t
MKVGGRIFFRVDLDVPGTPHDTVTIIHNHLEIKTRPSGREAQLAEILSRIKGIPHTVIMAGDHNTAQNDLSPTSAARIIKRTSTDPQTWLGLGLKVLMAAPVAVNTGRVAVNTVKNFHSPLALHGHRNGYGALSRHPLLGFSFNAWQTLWRLAGVDHMHVHGLQGKFSQTDEEVIESAHDTLAPLCEGLDDR